MRNPIPGSRSDFSTTVMSASMFTPSAERTSADPVFDESARLPCLATGTPHPATTNAAAVEMLKVPEASPPVPQVRSEEHTSELQSREKLVCRRLHE